MRILLATAVTVLAASSSCCCFGGGSAPSVTVVSTDCGEVELDIRVSAGPARDIEVNDGQARLLKTESVGWFEDTLVVAVPMREAGSLIIADGDQYTDVDITEVSAIALGVSVDGAAVEGEPTALRISATSGPTCDFHGTRLVVQATPEGGGATRSASGEAAVDGFAVRFESLSQGDYDLSLSMLNSHDVLLAEHTAALEVTPPCVDEDGDGSLACSGDCNDQDPSVHPGAKDVRGDGIDSDCDGANGHDRDRDGFEDARAGGDDCDDLDAAIHPGAMVVDGDGDGFLPGPLGADLNCDGKPDVQAGSSGDCDDHNASVHPQDEEPPTGNGRDDDCDGTVDEGTNLFDDDGDGQTEEQGDCDDADARRHSDAVETYDCVDNDCDQTVDEGVDVLRTDDRYEPNDSTDVRLSAAKKVFLGWRGTDDVVSIISRDSSDIETFSIVAHDGLLDHFNVTIELLERGQGVQYEAVIKGPHGTVRTGTLAAAGAELAFGGTADHSDTGTYILSVKPVNSALEYCPARFRIRSH
ncbi:MAG: hypothetical protein KC912_14700 [Proteobacteria bacterium]|nr:hypothetical protein [Pseudomonadota bacterium]